LLAFSRAIIAHEARLGFPRSSRRRRIQRQRQIHRHEMIAILSNDEDTDVLGLRTQTLRLLKRDARAGAARP